jgi:WD40 repeat protein
MSDDTPKEPPGRGEFSDPLKDTPIPQIPDHALLRCIGKGSYGEVWLARNVMGTYRAIKVVYRRTFESDRPYEREFSGMKMFEPVSRSHDSLVDILQVGRNEAAGHFYYVMELSDDLDSGQQIDPEKYEPKTLGKELFRRGRLPLEECVKLGLSLAGGLGHLHEHGLIHRDIKPSNIVFVNGIPKIADIGLVAEVGTSRSFVGTEGFIPPEGPGTPQADIFSLGKVLYEISSGKDRQTFPELPTCLDDLGNQQEYLELNAVILKACESDVRKRYKTAEGMHTDLLLLEAGKSVRRLRVLERRLALLKRVGLAIGAMILLTSAAYYQVFRGRQNAIQALVRSYVANGTEILKQGDLLKALPWFAAVLRLDQGNAKREDEHRIRLLTALRLCPKLNDVFFEDVAINDVAFSPDGTKLVTAGMSNCNANVWQIDSRQRVLTLVGHSQDINTAIYSPDGKLILTASADTTARLWDADTGKELGAKRMMHPWSLKGARFNPKGNLVITAGANGTARIWDWTLMEAREIPTGTTVALRDAAFSPDGRLVITASEDSTARIWDLETLEPVGAPLRHESWVNRSDFSPDGRYVVTASFDRSARIWDLRTGLQIRRWEHDGPFHTAEFSPDGRYVVTGGWEERTVQVWDVGTGKEIPPKLRHNANIMSATFSADGRRVLTATSDRIVCIWDLSARNWVPPSISGAFAGSGNRYATLSNQVVCMHEVGNPDTHYPPIAAAHPLDRVFLNHDGSRLFATSIPPASPDRLVHEGQLWNGVMGKPLAKAFSFSAGLTNACLSDDGQRVLLFAGTNAALYNPVGGNLIATLAHEQPVSKAALAPTRRLALTIGGSNVFIWSLLTGRKERVFVHSNVVTHAEFSRDERYLATACGLSSGGFGLSTAHIWDVQTGRPIGKPLEHSDDVRCIAFNPAGDQVVTASEDRFAQVWQVATGQRVGPAMEHYYHVLDAAFSPDGRWVVTACAQLGSEHTAQVWNAQTSEPMTPPLRHMFLERVRFTPDGRSILTTGRGLTRIWPLSSGSALENPSIDDLVLLARLYSGYQNVEVRGNVPANLEVFRADWTHLRQRLPELFSASTDQIKYWEENEAETGKAWHRQQVAECEEKQQWFAASFHLERLIALEPEDNSLRPRRDRAQREWNKLAPLKSSRSQ